MPNEQSTVFPNAPPGIVYPGDQGVSRTLAPPGNRDFAPRVGLAYSPSSSGDGVLAKILGGPGKTSIRASYGIFYTAIEALSIGVMSANAPYGSTYTSPAPPAVCQPVRHTRHGPESWPGVFRFSLRLWAPVRSIPIRPQIFRSSSLSAGFPTISRTIVFPTPRNTCCRSSADWE